jgi:hypothetical protein
MIMIGHRESGLEVGSANRSIRMRVNSSVTDEVESATAATIQFEVKVISWRVGLSSEAGIIRERGEVRVMADPQRSVETFVHAHLRSVEDLQLFIRLVEDPRVWWDTETVSEALHLSTSAARVVCRP